MSLFANATRGEWISGIGLLISVGVGIAVFFQDKGAMQRSIENTQTNIQQRNRENDALRAELNSLREKLLCPCVGARQ